MLASLARTLTLPDETVVLPGHGLQTTIGAERAAWATWSTSGRIGEDMGPNVLAGTDALRA